jgi:N-acetylglucosamine kinase-like BadF-type ATPase
MSSAGDTVGIEYYTGFDGGGTYTRVLVEDLLGNEVFRSRGDGSNIYKLGIAQAVRNISQLVQQIVDHVPDYHQNATRVCLGLAGVTEGKAPAELIAALSELRIGTEQFVHNDAYLTWYSIAHGNPAIALISGTGSVAFGVDESGEVVTSGGYGYLYADEGSGFDIGASGIRAAVRAIENRGPATVLTKAVMSEYKLKQMADLVERLSDPQAVAGFAPVVHEHARRGDGEAIRIIADAAVELVSLLKSAHERGNFQRSNPVKTALFGGCLRDMELLRARVSERIAGLGMEECTAKLTPEQAAVEIARSAEHSGSSD